MTTAGRANGNQSDVGISEIDATTDVIQSNGKASDNTSLTLSTDIFIPMD
jgi:hypothetical protein